MPNNHEVLYAAAIKLVVRNRYSEALGRFQEALALAPNAEEIHHGHAFCLGALGRLTEALAAYDRLIELNSHDARYHHARAHVLEALNRNPEAKQALARGVSADPTYVPAAVDLALHRLARCDWPPDLAPDLSEAARASAPAVPSLSLALLSGDPLLQLDNARRFIAPLNQPVSAPRVQFDGHRKVRIAYLSADYRSHPGASAIAEVIERHDRERFEVIAVSFGPDDASPMRHRLKISFDRFHDVSTFSDVQVAQILKSHCIDIAVDLTGLAEYGRPGILAQRVVPVQVNYIFPGTLGASFMDYIIADPFLIPPAHEVHFSERVARLPHTYLATDTRRPTPKVAPSRAANALPESGVVFCSFNRVIKIQPELWTVWMRLLARTDGSVLWLLCDDAEAQANLIAATGSHGVDPARLIFAPRLPPEQHIARMRAADLFLDTFPYNAHGTAVDVLWAGVPLVTYAGETFASRACGSILRAAGLPELVADSVAAYERIAGELAADPERLRILKAKVDVARTQAPLFDTARFTRNLEAAYLRMLERAARGEPATSFSITDP